ncbi:MAG TPA: hypothetical protein PKK06_16505 [Phycisphaerae bacterium]|nr:hypothetical protein [Phycisphaerae bacterium]HNU45922.1 hypothetical protein [Phycisphaerae bacterium]
MSPQRRWLALACLCLVVAPTAGTVSYALYLRSSAYRMSVARAVGDYLGLQVEIGAVSPRSLHSREFRSLTISLGAAGPEIFACRSAIWDEAPRTGVPGASLRLRDGWLLAGAQDWTSDHYDRLLAAGLGHEFAELPLREVRLEDFDVRFRHSLLEFRAEDAAGLILFDDAGLAHATLSCSRLNGVSVARPVHITAVFNPGVPLTFHEVRLTVPPLPLTALGTTELLGHAVTSGTFEGALAYCEGNDSRTVTLTGALCDARLDELTAQLPGGPYHGLVELDLDSAVFEETTLRSLEARGRLADLRLGELLPLLAATPDASRLQLDLQRIRWRDGRVVDLSATGRCDDLPLEGLSALLGAGRVTGTLSVGIHALRVTDGGLHYADIEITARPPSDQPGTIDRGTLAWLARRTLGLDLNNLLPETVEYAALGVRLIYDDGLLHVRGSHGPDHHTILTVRLAGAEVALINQQPEPLSIPDPWPLLYSQAQGITVEDLVNWWEKTREGHGPEPD